MDNELYWTYDAANPTSDVNAAPAFPYEAGLPGPANWHYATDGYTGIAVDLTRDSIRFFAAPGWRTTLFTAWVRKTHDLGFNGVIGDVPGAAFWGAPDTGIRKVYLEGTNCPELPQSPPAPYVHQTRDTITLEPISSVLRVGQSTVLTAMFEPALESREFALQQLYRGHWVQLALGNATEQGNIGHITYDFPTAGRSEVRFLALQDNVWDPKPSNPITITVIA